MGKNSNDAKVERNRKRESERRRERVHFILDIFGVVPVILTNNAANYNFSAKRVFNLYKKLL